MSSTDRSDAAAPGTMAHSEVMPLLTVAVVCLNAATHIAEALDSVLRQEFDDMELVIIDGGSTDGTLDVIRGYEPRFSGRLRWSSEPDKGLYDAMNKALGVARGEYIVFLGADDRLLPRALATAAAAIDDAPVDIVCGATRVIGEGGGWTESPRLVMRRGLPKSAPARHQSIYVRRELAARIGGFDTRYRIAADYDLYLRLKAAGARETLIDSPLSEFRLGGLSSRNAMATAREYRDIRVAHGANAFVEHFVAYKSALGVSLFALRHRTVGTPPSGGD